MSQTTTIELEQRPSNTEGGDSTRKSSTAPIVEILTEPGNDAANITTAIPNGGYGWVVVTSCAIITFLFNGLSGSWGVIQTALLDSSLPDTSTSTVTFVGSLALACCVALGLVAVRLISVIGARNAALLGILALGTAEVLSSFTTSQVGGLFATSGLIVGLGQSLLYTVSNSTPPQYFSSKLGLANGFVKLGGGIGATVLSITLEALIRRVGTAWMFRILGIVTLATGLPAAWLIKERTPMRNAPFIDLGTFRNLPFVAVFLAAATGTFALFVPPYFLPLFAKSAGLSSKTGASLVAGFNACASVGRFTAGPICDRIGPLNTFLLAMLLNAVSMLAIWPVSNSIAPLVLFAVLNGVANGAFFTSLPTVVASMVGSGLAAVAMSMNITGWTGGYLLGTPIAGYLLQATGADKAESIDLYRPAIFYAGGVALASSVFVLLARVKLDRKIRKRI